MQVNSVEEAFKIYSIIFKTKDLNYIWGEIGLDRGIIFVSGND
jgi:hypothetical protein